MNCEPGQLGKAVAAHWACKPAFVGVENSRAESVCIALLSDVYIVLTGMFAMSEASTRPKIRPSLSYHLAQSAALASALMSAFQEMARKRFARDAR